MDSTDEKSSTQKIMPNVFMNYTYTVIIAIILFQNVAFSGTREYCEDQWPDDYQKVGKCENTQYEALKKFYQYAENLGLIDDGVVKASNKGDAREKIMHKCMSKWERPLFHTYDYQMIVRCIESQFEDPTTTCCPMYETKASMKKQLNQNMKLKWTRMKNQCR